MTQEWIHALYILRHQRNLLRGPRALSGPQAILACGDDNTHELALHCLRIVLEERGYGVIFLGARVPATQLKACIDRENPVLVGVSFSPLSSSQEINDAYETLAGGEWQNYALVFGGVWLNQELKLQSFLRFGYFTNIREFSRWLKYGET